MKGSVLGIGYSLHGFIGANEVIHTDSVRMSDKQADREHRAMSVLASDEASVGSEPEFQALQRRSHQAFGNPV
jgi:hypothetical protein